MRICAESLSVRLLAGSLLLAALLWPVPQASAAEKFVPKRISALIAATPGGGTDGTSRLVGRYLSKYLPGKPQMLFRNMPVGHGSKALTHFYHRVKPDGLTWTGGSSVQVDPTNLRRDVFNYNPTHFEFIGGVSRGGSILMLRKALTTNLADKTKKPVVAGVIDGSRSWALLIAWGADKLDWNIRFVVGYPGTPSLMLAARRGEVDMVATSNIELLKGLFRTKKFVGASQFGQTIGGKIAPRSTFPKVPLITEQMKKAKLAGLAKETFNFWFSLSQQDKWYALPPKTPKHIVNAYRVAWNRTTADKDFIKQGKALFSQDFLPQDGAFVHAGVKATAYPKKELLDYIAKMKLRRGLPAHGLSDEERKTLAAKLVGKIKLVSATATLKSVKRAGRILTFDVKGGTHKVRVSSSKTKVVIAGQKTKRKNLKPGLKCLIKYLGDGLQARLVDCK